MVMISRREEEVFSVLLTSATRATSLYLIYCTQSQCIPVSGKTVLAVGTIIDKTLLKELELEKER